MNKTVSPINITQYGTLIFDCDGVILNSNPIKTEAFYQAALPYGKREAKALRDFHIKRGGISRYHKFDWFLTEIIGQEQPDEQARQELLDNYASSVWSGMLKCEIDDAIFELRKITNKASWMVASGGDQDELRQLFQSRNIEKLFDGGIFGSPTKKEDIIKQNKQKIPRNIPAALLGDSNYDKECAKKSGIDFIFVKHWSDIPLPSEPDYKEIDSLQDLIETPEK